mgnify:CR=1 FL=1
MQRVTVTLDDDLMAGLDRTIASRGYQNRSEAIRDLVRAGAKELIVDAPGDSECVAALVYVLKRQRLAFRPVKHNVLVLFIELFKWRGKAKFIMVCYCL